MPYMTFDDWPIRMRCEVFAAERVRRSLERISEEARLREPGETFSHHSGEGGRA